MSRDEISISTRLKSLRPRRADSISLLQSSNFKLDTTPPPPPQNPLKRCQQDNPKLLIHDQKRRRSVVDAPPPTPESSSVLSQPPIPEDLVSRLSEEILQSIFYLAQSRSGNGHEFTTNVHALLWQYYLNEYVSPSSDACSTSSSTYARPAAAAHSAGNNSSSSSSNAGGGDGYHRSNSSGSSTRPVAATRERKSYAVAAGRSAPMRSLSPAHPSAVMSGMDDFLRPDRFDRIMQMTKPDQFIQEQHSWNPEDRSLNIFVKDEDKFTFHRHPVAQSTDCIRGKMGYSRGFHVWQIEWPERQRGTHAVVGVATKNAPLHAAGYTALIGTTDESYGWDITRRECHHDSKHTMTWRYPFSNSRDVYNVPDKFYCILDMDEGYMAFATDDEFLGVAFRNLKGKTLYPIVAAVWGHCEISMRYLGSLEPEPLSLSELCRRRVRIEMGAQPEDHIEQLMIPPILKRYLMYQY
ncbi:SPRY domain-containing SOCS box protein 1 [Caenorhabditis elegans]|uniref:SPRY domain-containing SOCS box protein 1 n=1 Tax=Caenorhabditis elegans TaxID=6239 RepID=U4PBC3_CAEEL|nr:SPRY domain-containing SOCS box protein 1 [Caenorhabditis elegans]CDH93152.1 SPRY domain-containing SOCS box protein 1 [Caenorhabditis elegans]|eukprot:NP_001293561.1 SPSB (SPry and Socs Box) family [Caenorhabditis elegans]